MMRLLFGSWPRRGITVAACVMAFAMGLTGALVVAVRKSPAQAEQVRRIPLIGSVAAAMAGTAEATLSDDGLAKGEDVETYRDIRPLSTEEISQLIEALRKQRRIYLDQRGDFKREQRRLSMARADLAKERKAIDGLREKVANEWDEIRKAREDLKKQVAVLKGEETANLKKLAKQYEAMKPEKAAPILKQLSENTAAKIMYLMRERNVGKILESLDEDAATRLSEKMALLKLGT